MLPFCSEVTTTVALGGGDEEVGFEPPEIGLATGCGCTDGTIKSSDAEGAEPSESDLRESDDADLGHDPRAAADSASAGHDPGPPPMMPPPGTPTPAPAAAAAARGGAGTFHAVFLAAALPGSAPSAEPAGSRRFPCGGGGEGEAATGGGGSWVGAAPPAAGDIGAMGVRGRGAWIGGEGFGSRRNGKRRRRDEEAKRRGEEEVGERREQWRCEARLEN